MDNVYARVGDSFQQIGGECPPGFVQMSGVRPEPDFVANASGEWVVPPPVVPNSVSAAQGGIALIHFGMMDAVMAVAQAPETPATHKWAFERSTIWERNSPSFNYLADQAGITEQQKDELFIFAAGVVP